MRSTFLTINHAQKSWGVLCSREKKILMSRGASDDKPPLSEVTTSTSDEISVSKGTRSTSDEISVSEVTRSTSDDKSVSEVTSTFDEISVSEGTTATLLRRFCFRLC